MFWQVWTMNMVCKLLECKTVPPDVAESISKISRIVTVGELAKATWLSLMIAKDVADLERELKDMLAELRSRRNRKQ